ncbi:MAG: PBSX family phage terminase large subunit [Alphaproteobacteria bacterium]|nr:PBSX family phage terminase large subunit [Alphaproteobacteria bacterium]
MMEIVDDFRPIIENVVNYKYRYFAYLTGRLGLGKSTNIASCLLVAGLMMPLRILCTRETMASIKESVHAQLSDIIHKNKLPYTIYNDTIRADNGTMFIFKGLKETGANNIRSLTNVDICWVEEAQAVSVTSWESLDPTIRAEGSFIIVSANPDNESDVVYQLFGPDAERRPDTYYCYKSYLDNPFPMPEAFLQNIELMKKNRPDDYEMIYLGKLRKSADNPVVKSWSDKNIGIGQTSKLVYWSLDFNINPQCSVICHWNGGRDFYFSDEIVLENVSTYKVAEEFVKIWRKKYNGQKVIINGDASGRNRSSNSEYSNYAIIEQILVREKVPFMFNVPKANTSIKNRVANFDWHVHGLDGKVHILVNPECRHLIHSCKLLSYDKFGNIIEVPFAFGMKTIDYAKSHIFDAASYCVMINDPVLENFMKPQKPRILSLKEQFLADLKRKPTITEV